VGGVIGIGRVIVVVHRGPWLAGARVAQGGGTPSPPIGVWRGRVEGLQPLTVGRCAEVRGSAERSGCNGVSTAGACPRVWHAHIAQGPVVEARALPEESAR
jgi:hypothetical protein